MRLASIRSTRFGRVCAPDEVHRRRIDLGRVPLVAVLVFPFTRLDPALDVDGAALREVLMAEFANTSPGDDPVPFRSLDPLSVLVVPGLAGRQREIADGLAVLRLSKFGIPAEVADENGFGDACHAERSIGTRLDGGVRENARSVPSRFEGVKA